MINRKMINILLCISLNEELSKFIIKYILEYYDNKNINIDLLHILDSTYKSVIFGSDKVKNDQYRNANKYLHKLIKFAKDIDNNINIDFIVKEGRISEEIINHIKKGNYNKLFIGKSNKSKTENQVTSNIIKEIGSKINIPVIVVPINLIK